MSVTIFIYFSPLYSDLYIYRPGNINFSNLLLICMVKRMERHVRALSHPEQPSPKQRYMKTPLASAEERKNGRRKRVRICSIVCYVLANVRELSFEYWVQSTGQILLAGGKEWLVL